MMIKKSTLSLCLASVTLALTACGGNGFNLSNTTSSLVSSSGDTTASNTGSITAAPKIITPVYELNINGQEQTISNVTITIGDKTFTTETIDLSYLPLNEVTTLDLLEKYDYTNPNSQGDKYSKEEKSKITIYHQPFSLVVTPFEINESQTNATGTKTTDDCNEFCNIGGIVIGSETLTLPKEGSATYNGVAYSVDNKGVVTNGDINYTVNFGQNFGLGEIHLPDSETINLNQASIQEFGDDKDEAFIKKGWGVNIGTLTQGSKEGQYSLHFFGDEAQEISGIGVLNEDSNTLLNIGFGAIKQP